MMRGRSNAGRLGLAISDLLCARHPLPCGRVGVGVLVAPCESFLDIGSPPRCADEHRRPHSQRNDARSQSPRAVGRGVSSRDTRWVLGRVDGYAGGSVRGTTAEVASRRRVRATDRCMVSRGPIRVGDVMPDSRLKRTARGSPAGPWRSRGDAADAGRQAAFGSSTS